MEYKEKRVRIKIISRQFDFTEEGESEFEPDLEQDSALTQDSSETLELVTEGLLRDKEGRVELEYEETELTGMQGATTIVSYDKSTPDIVSVLRDGSISTALVFEPGSRHICAYDTPFFPLELCVATTSLKNKLTYEGGSLELDYIIESGGERTERTQLSLFVLK